MSLQQIIAAPAEHELYISRLIDAPRIKVFRACTEPGLLAQWWGPHGMTTPVCEMQLWAGGLFRTVMCAPDGGEHTDQGVFLEILAPQRIVYTDAFLPGWIPSKRAFMTAIITFDEVQGMTRFTARALHWSAVDREIHEQLGFYRGWGESLDRLVDVVTRKMPD